MFNSNFQPSKIWLFWFLLNLFYHFVLINKDPVCDLRISWFFFFNIFKAFYVY